ncbi:MAG: alpha/beta hydrolase [Candidatus Binatus sp.]|uniref:alpha/beta fold hydrolase n=1 Tax=Candidatus Binatus sp. TaxID=2811406 RepID=UPI002715D1A1|nr:alpha/beta hydrolase [Candidatus Binatus sp.]MDO8435017.1 alpha/beta hydrolase [Candidatus Binatus sp.]
MANWTEETISVAGTELAMVKGGAGKPLLIFHDELGYTGWMTWNMELAEQRQLLMPLQPGFGKTPRLDWVRNYRDLAGYYSRVMRELHLDPVDVIGFSAGGFIAAEMAAADPRIFSRMILVAPMGIRPAEGEIMDIFPMTMRTHLRATVADPLHTPEFTKIYGGEMTPVQFEAFEEARAESARIGWEPYMHNPSLPHLLEGLSLPTLLIWGDHDRVVPRGCVDAYRRVIKGAQVQVIQGAGHRPEIENCGEFVKGVRNFLKS